MLKIFNYLKLERLKFRHVGRGYWEKEKNRREYLIELGKKLGINNKFGWYAITEKDFINNRGISLLGYYEHSPGKCVISLLPEYNFDITGFDFSSKFEYRLRCYAKCFFGINKIISNFKSSKYLFKNSMKKMEFDIFVPSKNIAFEYNGEQHYRPIKGFVDKSEFLKIKNRDKEKKLLSEREGITLITVKYNQWDGMPDSFLDILSNYFKINKIDKINFYKNLNKDEIFNDIIKYSIKNKRV